MRFCLINFWDVALELGDARWSFARLLHLSLTPTDSKTSSYSIDALAKLPDGEVRFPAYHLKTEDDTRPRKPLDLTPALGLNIFANKGTQEHQCRCTQPFSSNPSSKLSGIRATQSHAASTKQICVRPGHNHGHPAPETYTTQNMLGQL